MGFNSGFKGLKKQFDIAGVACLHKVY